MRKEKIVKKMIIMGLIVFYVTLSTPAQTQEYSSPALKWKPTFGFSNYVQEIIYKTLPKMTELLNFQGVVSTVAIPTLQSPVKNMKELEAGKTIGTIFLSTGSLRLNLAPGAYQVDVIKRANEWRALFLDGNGQISGDVPAEVTEATPVDIPFAYVDRSNCFRFDKVLVRY